MVKRIIRKLPGNIPTAIVAAGMLLYVTAIAWPTSWWLSVNSISIFDAKVGEPIVMRVDRTISRPFYAHWRVIIRAVSARGVTQYCTATGDSNYRTDAALPNPLTLDWWASPECARLPAGRYQLSTIWQIALPGGINKEIVVESNPFTIFHVPVAGNRSRIPQSANTNGIMEVL